MSKKGAFIYQQIEKTTAEWAEDTTVYPASVWLFERLEDGKFNMKLSDGEHGFSGLEAVFQDIDVKVTQNDDEGYKLTITTAGGEIETPNLKGKDGAISEDAPSDQSAYGRKAGSWAKVVEAVEGKVLSTNDYDNDEKQKVADSLRLKEYTDVTDLGRLPSSHYNLRYTYSADSSPVTPAAIDFADDAGVKEMQEFYLSIRNDTEEAITQPIPNDDEGWQSDEESIEIEAGKIAGISIKKEHGVMVVRV